MLLYILRRSTGGFFSFLFIPPAALSVILFQYRHENRPGCLSLALISENISQKAVDILDLVCYIGITEDNTT